MKKWAIALGIAALVVFAPVAQAVPVAVDGMSGLVESTGATQVMRFRFPISSDDPGSYTYNVTIDNGTITTFSDVETLLSATRENGLITAYVVLTDPGVSYDAYSNAYDGVNEGTASCTVTIDSSVLYSYDSCGSMAPSYQTNYCLNVDGGDFGFAVTQGVKKGLLQDLLSFTIDGDKSAYGGLNLGGDSVEYQYQFEMRSVEDGSVSKILFFFSSMDLEASASAVGDASSTVKTSFTVPRTGSFANGIGVAFEESGADYVTKIFYNDNGTTYLLDEVLWTDGINSNELTAGAITFSDYTGIFQITLGNEFATFDTSEIKDFPVFHTFWAVEYGGKSFLNTRSFHVTDGVANCIYTLSAELGGAVAESGAPSEVQNFESFDGQGGAINAPSYPFIDMQSVADGMEISVEALGYIMVAVSMLILAVVGFLAGGKTGLLVGVMLVLPFTVQLGDLPRWLAVLVFLGCVSYGVLKKGKSSGGFLNA